MYAQPCLHITFCLSHILPNLHNLSQTMGTTWLGKNSTTFLTCCFPSTANLKLWIFSFCTHINTIKLMEYVHLPFEQMHKIHASISVNLILSYSINNGHGHANIPCFMFNSFIATVKFR